MNSRIQGLIDLLTTADTWEDEDGDPRFPEESDIPKILKQEAQRVEEYIEELLEEIAGLKEQLDGVAEAQYLPKEPN